MSLTVGLACAACGVETGSFDWNKYQPPDWRKFQARDARLSLAPQRPGSSHKPDYDRVTFHDLKTESDSSLAQRLLGLIGRRITYIDRHRDRWRYYRSEGAPAESIDLYTHPAALGSQYGLCGVEKYSVRFDDSGRVQSVSQSERYGVEGAIFQKGNFDWDFYGKQMCKAAPASHAPSYFPAVDESAALDLVTLLVPVIDLAASSTPLPYKLECRQSDGRPCGDDVRKYLGRLRLEEIGEFSRAKCPPHGGPREVCFTIKTGERRLGPFPKYITVTGSTYMHNIRVDLVDVDEGFTVS